MFSKDVIEKWLISKWLWKIVVVFFCSILVLCAGSYKIEEISITNDEATTIFIASHNNVTSVMKSERDTYPPLYYIAVHLFLQIYPEREVFMVRFLSLIFGVLSVPLFFILLRRVAPSYNPLPAVALFSASELLIYFSREGRCYSIVLFVSIISGLALMKVIERDDFKSWFIYVMVSVGLCYIHYFTAFFLVSQAIFFIISCLVEKRTGLIKRFVLASFIMGILLLPLYPDIIMHAGGSKGLFSGPDYDVDYLKQIILTLTYDWRKLQLIYLFLYLLGTWRCFIQNRKLFMLNLILFFVPLVLSPAFFKFVASSYFEMKYVIYVLPYFIIPVSIGFLYLCEIAKLKMKRHLFFNGASTVFILIIMSVMLTDLKVYTISNYFNNKTHSNWKQAFHLLNISVKSDDGIGFYPNYVQKIYHIYSLTDADTFFFGSTSWRPITDRYRFQSVALNKLNNDGYESIFKKYNHFWIVIMREYEYRGYENIRKYFCKYFLEREMYSLGRIKIFKYQRRL